MVVVVRIYKDHDASADSDNVEYTSLCDECAEERDVTYLSTEPAGDGAHCDDCLSSNRTEEEEY
jgi:hypothetical protein